MTGSGREGGGRLRAPRVVGLLLGVAAVAAGAEVSLRVDPPEAATNAVQQRAFGTNNPRHPARGIYMTDDRLGYRPVPGSEKYGSHGALVNEYELAKDPRRERVLFLGDSCIERGTLVRAIRDEFGEDAYEWWNAGVGAYSVPQEVGYYRDYLGDIQADHVVLGFNMTDFEATPLMTIDGEGKLQLFNARRSGTNLWLLRHSYLYRYYVGRSLAPPAIGQVDESLVESTEARLAELRDLTRERGATLLVIVLPWMRPLEMWTPLILGNYRRTLTMLDRLGIRSFDGLPLLEETVAAGEPLGEPAGDLMHPSAPLCRRIAAALAREGFPAGTK